MSKASRGTTRSSAGKKKAKKRPEPRPATGIPGLAEERQPVQRRDRPEEASPPTVLQFRPRAREAGATRPTGRAIGAARAPLPVIDYGYVYSDIRIIGVLSAVLFGGLIALSFVIR